jgi:hypothetical protein
MNQLDAVLIAMAHREGRALRTAAVRHRRLLERPLVVSLWQLGSEPFSAAAIAFGDEPGAPSIVVAGDPRSRDLSFAALMKFAAWFLPRFEGPAAARETVASGSRNVELSTTLHQIVVANRATIELMARLGRRLAYLPTDGDRPAPIELVRLGQHLQFLGRHADLPGQQLIVPIGELVAEHWATPQTEFERSSLPALDAFVDPPAGLSGFDAAALAELTTIGPTPSGEDDRDLDPLVADFNAARARRTEAAVVEPLLGPIIEHYRPLVTRSWELIWRSLRRERDIPEARSVPRRWDVDRREYVGHIDWVNVSGRVRTRQTARQAINTMRRMEEAKARLIAEEALDDPIRMIPYLLDGKALEGVIVAVDPTHSEVARVNLVRRPLVVIRSESERALPVGKELWATDSPGGPSWRVHGVARDPDGGTLVTMKLQTSNTAGLPAVGTTICLSIHNTKWRPGNYLAPNPPWPMRPTVVAEPAPIETTGADAA